MAPLDFAIPLFVRRYYGGQVLVRLLSDPSTCIYAEEVEGALEDLELLLTDRLERMHPSGLHRLLGGEHAHLERTSLEDGITLFVDEAKIEARPLRVSYVVSRHKGYERVWFPSWDLRDWVDVKADLAVGVQALLDEYRGDLSTGELLDRRGQGQDSLHTLALAVRPPPLAAFTGKHLGRASIPQTAPQDDDGDERARKKPKIATPVLDEVGTNLVERASKKELGRALEMHDLVVTLDKELSAKDGAAVALVGPPGVGKTALVHELAHRRHEQGDKSGKRKNERLPLWFVDAPRLIAMGGPFSDWRTQTMQVMDEIMALDAVWYVGDIYSLLDAGKSAQSEDNVSQLLRPKLSRRKLRLVGECTEDEWSRLELRDPGFARLFSPLRLEEPDKERSLRILRGIAEARRGAEGPSIELDGVVAAREIAERFGGHSSVHAASIALVQRGLEDLLAEEREAPRALDRVAVVDTFCHESGMAPVLIRDDLPLDPEAVRRRLEERIVAQPEAVGRMTDLVSVIKAGLSEPKRPLGSFLFVGPTGVGKTETAKALAAYLFGPSARLIRFDMSEFVSGDAVQRFVGLGGQPGKLVSEVRRAPFSVLLLDEIEKAHPAAFDALLQVLGEARLTDGAGRTASFGNVVVVMTSNLGVDTLTRSVGFGEQETRGWSQHFVSEARKFFRPELFNRIDHVVAFASLAEEAIRGITDRELAHLGGREGLAPRGLRLELGASERRWLARRGTDPRYGARPLKRTLEREVAQPLAERLSATPNTAPGTWRAELAGERLEFHFEPDKQRKGGSERALRETVDEVTELRYLVTACGHVPQVRDLRLEVERVERLFSNPDYLRGHEQLRERLGTVDRDLRLVADFDALTAHAQSLEDLAYEAWHTRQTATVADLDREREEALEDLGSLGVRLAGRHIDKPHRAVLYLQARAATFNQSKALLEAYAALAQDLGLRVTAHEAVEGPASEPTEDEPTSTYFEAIEPALPSGEPDPEARGRSRQKHLQAVTARVGQRDTVLALRFEGDNAAVLLAAEGGVHEWHQFGETRRVSIRYDADVTRLDEEYGAEEWEAFEGAWDGAVRRTVHGGKHLVTDKGLEMSLPIEPRLERVYRRFIMAHVYRRAFFRGADEALARGRR